MPTIAEILDDLPKDSEPPLSSVRLVGVIGRDPDPRNFRLFMGTNRSAFVVLQRNDVLGEVRELRSSNGCQGFLGEKVHTFIVGHETRANLVLAGVTPAAALPERARDATRKHDHCNCWYVGMGGGFYACSCSSGQFLLVMPDGTILY